MRPVTALLQAGRGGGNRMLTPINDQEEHLSAARDLAAAADAAHVLFGPEGYIRDGVSVTAKWLCFVIRCLRSLLIHYN